MTWLISFPLFSLSLWWCLSMTSLLTELFNHNSIDPTEGTGGGSAAGWKKGWRREEKGGWRGEGEEEKGEGEGRKGEGELRKEGGRRVKDTPCTPLIWVLLTLKHHDIAPASPCPTRPRDNTLIFFLLEQTGLWSEYLGSYLLFCAFRSMLFQNVDYWSVYQVRLLSCWFEQILVPKWFLFWHSWFGSVRNILHCFWNARENVQYTGTCFLAHLSL